MSKRGQTVKICIFLEFFWLLLALSSPPPYRYVAVISLNLMMVAAFVCQEISLIPGAAPREERNPQ